MFAGRNGIYGMDEEHQHRQHQKQQQQQQQQIVEYDKSNNNMPLAIKPYWYIDPSMVYRAVTSPVIMKLILPFQL